MIVEQIKKLMTACGYFDYGLDKTSQLEIALERDVEFTIEKIKSALNESFLTQEFDWVNLAIESKFVYTSDDVSSNDFGVDSLLIFTDSFRWKDIVQLDAVLSIGQKEKLKSQFREIGVQYFKDIVELMEYKDFDWLPFEVKHAYILNFKAISYTEEDIIFHLKNTIWDYLYPNMLKTTRLNSIKEESLNILRSQQINEGWIEMSTIVDSLKDLFPGLDLYELSRVNWNKDIQHKIHHRNPFTLGFKRIDPTSRR